jgi:hypothetical protein
VPIFAAGYPAEVGGNAMSENIETDRKIAVVRDCTFHRFAADRIMVTDLGRDLEVSFMQIGPLFSQMEAQDDGEEFSSESVFTEVARMRIGYPNYVNSLFNFLRVGIQEDKLNAQGIINQITEWMTEYPEGSKE